jgi:ATP-dependent protease ClpP protease subunit
MGKFAFGRSAVPAPQVDSRRYFQAAVGSDGVLELMIYGDIVDAATISMLEAWGYSTDGFVSAIAVKKALDGSTGYSSIRVRINSPGGDAFEGMAIHSLLTSSGKPVIVQVDGIAASSASIIAMAGSQRIMGRSAMMMIHDAWAGCIGNSRDMQKMAEALDKIDESIAAAYFDRTGLKAEDIRSLMDEETWLSAQDCVEQGFATAIVEPPAEEERAAMAMARGFKVLARLKKLPQALRGQPPNPPTTSEPQNSEAECECRCEECVEGNCAKCSNPDCVDENCVDCPMQEQASAKITQMDMARARQRQRDRERALKQV